MFVVDCLTCKHLLRDEEWPAVVFIGKFARVEICPFSEDATEVSGFSAIVWNAT